MLTHQFLDQRVGAPVQLSQEAQAKALRQSERHGKLMLEPLDFLALRSGMCVSLASYLIQRPLHAPAGVVGCVLEGPAQRAQAVVRPVARPVHQVGIGLLPHGQVEPEHQHRPFAEEANKGYRSKAKKKGGLNVSLYDASNDIFLQIQTPEVV